MRLRHATEADLAVIMEIERACFPSDAWSETMMREELLSPHGHYLVLEDEECASEVPGAQAPDNDAHVTPLAADGRVIGYAGLRAPRSAHDADVQTIAVASEARGRGGGRILLHALLDEARDRGIGEVFLDVRADNPAAQQLYRSEGFEEIARRRGYYQPDGVDALVMRRRRAPAAPVGVEVAAERSSPTATAAHPEAMS